MIDNPLQRSDSMKNLLVTLPLLLLPAAGHAEGGLPLDETSFVDAVQNMTKDKIAELLGQPANSFEVKDKFTGELLGYVWNYQYLNTSDDGNFYKTTELDLVNDRVATIVFSNGEESTENDTPMEGTAEGECTPTC
jgi:hypothetical protein